MSYLRSTFSSIPKKTLTPIFINDELWGARLGGGAPTQHPGITKQNFLQNIFIFRFDLDDKAVLASESR